MLTYADYLQDQNAEVPPGFLCVPCNHSRSDVKEPHFQSDHPDLTCLFCPKRQDTWRMVSVARKAKGLTIRSSMHKTASILKTNDL